MFYCDGCLTGTVLEEGALCDNCLAEMCGDRPFGLCIMCEENPMDTGHYCIYCIRELEYFEADRDEDWEPFGDRVNKICTACFVVPPMRGRNICRDCYLLDVWYEDAWVVEAPTVIPPASEEIESFGAVRS